MTKGYRLPKPPEKPLTIYRIYVGCRNCQHRWYEEMERTSHNYINGALMIYDYCSECTSDSPPRN